MQPTSIGKFSARMIPRDSIVILPDGTLAIWERKTQTAIFIRDGKRIGRKIPLDTVLDWIKSPANLAFDYLETQAQDTPPPDAFFDTIHSFEEHFGGTKHQ